MAAELKDKGTELAVRVAVYPKFETRGDLVECVEDFRGW